MIDKVAYQDVRRAAAGCSPIVTAYDAGVKNVQPVRPSTIAKSLAIGNPADGFYALGVMEETNGHAVSATDDEIIEGMKLLARTEGIFAETAGGVVIAGLKKLAEAGGIRKNELTVAFITGAGLKTQEAVKDTLEPPLQVEPSITAFEEALGARREANVQAANA